MCVCTLCADLLYEEIPARCILEERTVSDGSKEYLVAWADGEMPLFACICALLEDLPCTLAGSVVLSALPAPFWCQPKQVSAPVGPVVFQGLCPMWGQPLRCSKQQR